PSEMGLASTPFDRCRAGCHNAEMTIPDISVVFINGLNRVDRLRRIFVSRDKGKLLILGYDEYLVKSRGLPPLRGGGGAGGPRGAGVSLWAGLASETPMVCVLSTFSRISNIFRSVSLRHSPGVDWRDSSSILNSVMPVFVRKAGVTSVTLRVLQDCNSVVLLA